MKDRNKIKIKEVMVWLKDQLTHPRTLFKRKSWGCYQCMPISDVVIASEKFFSLEGEGFGGC